MLKGRHSDSDSESDSESETNIKINIPRRHVTEKTVSVDQEGSCNMVTSIWSVEGSILSSIQDRAEPSGVNLLQLYFWKWTPGGSALYTELPGSHFGNASCRRLTPDGSVMPGMLMRMLSSTDQI